VSLFSKVQGRCLAPAAILTVSIAFAPAAAAQQPDEPAEAEAPQADRQGEPGINSHIIVYGAAKDPASADLPAAPEDRSVPELPIVYEDEDEAEPAKVSAPADAALPASPAR